MLYEAQTYASFQTPGQHSTPGVDAETLDDLKRSPQYVVGTPDEVLARLRALPADGGVVFNPLAGGLPPDARVAEPRAVRGRGAASPPRRERSRKPWSSAAFRAYRRGDPRPEVAAWPGTADST